LKCITDFKTPDGRKLSFHAYSDSLGRHGFKPPYIEIDYIITNYSRKTTQIKDGTLSNVYIKKQSDGKYGVVIENSNDGTIITALKNLTSQSLKNLGKKNGFNPNP
jgi:hypothetical protein